MLTQSVDSYLAVRRACGFQLKTGGDFLRSFAIFSEARGKHHVCSETAIEWAGLSRSAYERARRLDQVIRFARYVRAEDHSHELPPAVFGSKRRPRSIPYIFPRKTSSVSYKRHLSLVSVLCVAKLTARCSLCWHARGCGCPKQPGCATMISHQMG